MPHVSSWCRPYAILAVTDALFFVPSACICVFLVQELENFHPTLTHTERGGDTDWIIQRCQLSCFAREPPDSAEGRPLLCQRCLCLYQRIKGRVGAQHEIALQTTSNKITEQPEGPMQTKELCSTLFSICRFILAFFCFGLRCLLRLRLGGFTRCLFCSSRALPLLLALLFFPVISDIFTPDNGGINTASSLIPKICEKLFQETHVNITCTFSPSPSSPSPLGNSITMRLFAFHPKLPVEKELGARVVLPKNPGSAGAAVSWPSATAGGVLVIFTWSGRARDLNVEAPIEVWFTCHSTG
jgi:hypothetical protein